MLGFKSPEEKALLLLSAIRDELSGIRLALTQLALKQQAVPLPDEPDGAAFLQQTDEDFALMEKLSREREVSDEADLLAEEAGIETEPLPESPRPKAGSFLPRFQR